MNQKDKNSVSPVQGKTRTEYRHHNSCVEDLDPRKRGTFGKLLRGDES